MVIKKCIYIAFALAIIGAPRIANAVTPSDLMDPLINGRWEDGVGRSIYFDTKHHFLEYDSSYQVIVPVHERLYYAVTSWNNYFNQGVVIKDIYTGTITILTPREGCAFLIEYQYLRPKSEYRISIQRYNGPQRSECQLFLVGTWIWKGYF